MAEPDLPLPLLVLGAGGLVGGELSRRCAARALAFSARRRAECDITSPSDVTAAVGDTGARLIVNCAAYNAVDRAETDVALAERVNRDGPENIARVTALASATVVHYSTDYVFDGDRDTPYVESDAVGPLSVYARAKAQGDVVVMKENPRHFVLRVGCLFGRGGRNYGSTVLARLRRGERVRADGERIVQPTWARSVADQTLALAATRHYGLYHGMSHGSTTWADFTRELCRLAGLGPALVESVPASAISAPGQLSAKRPRYSVLENRALQQINLDLMPDWRDALAAYLADCLTDCVTDKPQSEEVRP